MMGLAERAGNVVQMTVVGLPVAYSVRRFAR